MTDKPLSICLWFDNQAEEAAKFYTSIFSNSAITSIVRYPSEGKEIHGIEEGKVMTIGFTINNQNFVGLNGGHHFNFNESVSFQIFCDDQQQIDFYWNKLLEDGGKPAQCGWLKDKFGISWQVIPSILSKLMTDPIRAPRVTKAFLQMQKFDIQKLIEA